MTESEDKTPLEPESSEEESREPEVPAEPPAEAEPTAAPDEAPAPEAEEEAPAPAADEEAPAPAAGEEAPAEGEPAPAARTPLELAADARYQATGKRKTAIARVILKPGSGAYTINKKTLEEYFPRPRLQRQARGPLEATGNEARMDVV